MNTRAVFALSPRSKKLTMLGVGFALAGALAACGSGEQTENASMNASASETSSGEMGTPFATAKLVTQKGEDAGTVTFTTTQAGTEINVDAKGLEPGFHGFHVHDKGKCEGDFKSAGGHLSGPDHAHGADHSAGYHPHAGDLPSLLAAKDGTAKLTVTTDVLTPELLLDGDGASLIVHEGRDNFANIPERYAPEGPDQDTLKTGDAGARFACGVIEAK
ncbi:superoxide dismutase family protein [Corynebacterium diphtheriae]|nr:superoxide dismutase family protein [Corynebacterium diphtheriae]